MRRVIETIPIRPTYVSNIGNKPIYTRFHRKPRIYPDQTYKIEKNFEQENMNNYLSNIYKEKKYRGVLDPAAPNNKNIFIDTDSELHFSEREEGPINPKKNEKSAKLLIAKTESQYPETYNSQNIFRRDGLTKGYFVNVNGNNNLNYNNYNNFNNTYNTLTRKNKNVQSIINTPSQFDENQYYYNYNKGPQTQMINQNMDNNNINQNYNSNTVNNGLFKKEIDLDEWPSVERNKKAKLYYRNKDIQVSDKENRTDSNNLDYQNNIYNNKVKKIPGNIIYRKGNISEIKASYSKSNISDISEDNLNQRRKQNEYNYILAGNTSGIASPIEYKNNNNFILGTSEEESEPQADFYGGDYQNYMNKQIIKSDINNDMLEHEPGGRINLYYGMKNKDIYRNKNMIIKKDKNANIIDTIKNDKNKYQALIKLQKAIKEYLYLRELYAMKIQAVWRGGNTRKIMELYNDLDEFIYHLSKVQFNHFNNNFCFFIKQLFNIYKSNVSNINYDIEYNENNENNKEEELENENENCINQISIEEIDKKEGTGSYFAPEKLELENEIALFVEGSSPYYERNNEIKIKENEDSNNINVNNRIFPKKEKNESESTIGSIKSDYKFHKFDKTGSNKKENKKNAEKKQKLRDNGTLSNDYDADLDINRDDDYFNQEDISYDDKDNSGSLIKDKRYSYFSIHSDENSKYFDNENRNEKENKEGDLYKINTSISKYNNSTKNTGFTGYTGYSHHDKSKMHGFRTDKINKREFSNSPSEKSNNYIGHHSKTLPRKYKNHRDYINTTALIIPKHEEDFNIINNKTFLSPKAINDKKHIKNASSEIAITPNIKFEDKNWNEIIEYIKNEEIEIPTQKNLRNIKTKKEFKKFDVLENEKINELNIDNKDYKNKKLSQIYIWHENELNIGKDRKIIGKEKLLIKEIEDKQNQIILFKKQLEEIMNKLSQPKVFDSQLEINNNLNSLNIKGKEKDKIIFKKINNEEININRKPKEIISLITKNNEFCIDQKMPEKLEAITDTSDLIPKQIKITTKKIVKKTDTLQYRFKNTLISSGNEINIHGKEKTKPIFEEESQENNRFSVKNIIENKESKDNEILRVKILNPEDLKIVNKISHIFSPLEEKKDKNEELKVILNNVISLNPIEKKREIKLVTKKVLKKTNFIHSKFNNEKAQISSTNCFDIKGEEKQQSKIELLSSEIDKLIKEEKLDQLSPELQSKIKILVIPKDKDIKEITKENTININGTGKKFDNIQLQKEEDKNNNRFTFESVPNIIKVNKNAKLNKKYENVINKKTKFTINSVKKKPEANIINKKSKFTINGIQKKPIELKDEEIQYEQNKDYISEKMTDTHDLIPKEIKIVTKKITKKTNILKKSNNIITHENEIKIEGIEIPEKEKEKEKEIETIKTDTNINQEINKNKDWNNLLKKEGQQYNFVIKRISKNIYDQYKKEKINKEKDDKKEEESDKKDIPKQKKMEKIEELPEEEYIDKEIKDKNILKSKKEKLNKDNIIVKKINFNIIGKKDVQKEQNEPQLSQEEHAIPQNNWNDVLKQDIQQDNFLINPDSNIKAKLEELENIKKAELNKPENNIDKNIEINIEPIDTLHLAKNKILDNWKESISENKSEDINIEKQPKKREIKIATRKITKKTNYKYKKFGDEYLAITKNDLNIEGNKKEQPEYLLEKIHLNIKKSYEKKRLNESELEIEKNKELFINANNYKKKEIRINTKKKIAKTNYIYKRFNNNLISNENQIQIENIKSEPTIITSFGNDKLETVPIEENKFTIIKTEDNKKENELKEKLQKEAEAQIKIKLEEENKELQNKIINENEELKKENEELKNKIKKESEDNKEKEEKINEPIATEEFTINKEYSNKNEIIENFEPLAIDDFTILNQQNIENEKIEENKEDKNIEKQESKDIRNNEPIAVEEFTINKEYNNKSEIIENIQPLAIDDFTIENQQNIEKENENKKYENYIFDNVQFTIKNKPKKVSEQGIQIEETKPEQYEKMTDTFDLEKKEIKITHRKILKKTNVLRHEFKHNSICPDTKLSINKPSDLLKERNNNIINKKICLTINNDNKEKEIKVEPKTNLLEIKKNDEIIIKRNKLNNINNNVIKQVTTIQLSDDKVQEPNEKITEKTFGDNTQLSNVKLHKPNKLITEKKKSASFDDLINLNIKNNEKSDEEQKTILKKRKGMNTKLVKGSNKKNKFENLVIKLDNKFELKNCFNKLNNNLTPNIYPKRGENINDMDKNKSLNLKQIVKEQDKKNLKLNILESNEKITDTINIEKSHEDLNTFPASNPNFETINIDDKYNTLDHISTNNITDENDKKRNLNKKLKVNSIKPNLTIPDNNNVQDENNDNILVNIANDDINRQSINSKSNGSIDNNIPSNFNSISNTSSIEINEKDSVDEAEQKKIEKIEKIEKPEEPKKKEIIIKKKICIVSKKQKSKIKYAEAKKKFFLKRFLIKCWKIWKRNANLIKEENTENENKKSIEQKTTKRPFTLKNKKDKKIHKLIVEKEKEDINKIEKEKYLELKDKIMSQNKMLIIRHFFLNWKKDKMNQQKQSEGISVIENILRRYIVRYLLMHGKIQKLKILLIKKIFAKHKTHK